MFSLASAALSQSGVILSGEHKWVSELTDRAASKAESLWFKCVVDAVGRRKGEALIDEVVRKCEYWLDLALDVETAATWIAFKHRSPDLFLPKWRDEARERLIGQIRRLAE